MIEFFSVFLNHSVVQGVFLWTKRSWFLWLPLLSAYFFWNSWLNQVRARFIKNISWVLLEIKVPRDIAKSPQALEVVLSSLHSTYAGNRRKRILAGFLPGWYSLEIAAIDGGIHFFIRTQKYARNFVESQIYAQYPKAEIVEVSDYTYAADFGNFNEWNLFGLEIGLLKADAYPIKTYTAFGLHEAMVEEEQKVNPLVSFLEFSGSLKQGEQVWFQVMIRGAGNKWIENGKKLIDELMGRDKPAVEGKPTGKNLSKGEQEVAAAIDRNIAKLGFETGIRILYVARRDIFNKSNMAALTGLTKLYNTHNLNGFRPIRRTDPDVLDFIFPVRREIKNKKTMLDAYRKRSYFYAPHKRPPFVLNTEELATIYHYPGRVAETPTFGRIESKKSEPPSTLPI